MTEGPAFQVMTAALTESAALLRTRAGLAGLDATVPTCPGWTVRDLITHTGLVYRWMNGYLARTGRVDEAAVLAEGHAAPDLLSWWDGCFTAVRDTISQAPADLAVKFFLPDAPPPRDAWLRRVVHETTIHAYDAISAQVGREPHSSELPTASWLAVDGIDEMLTGYVPRSSSAILEVDQRVMVSATDAAAHWLLTGTPQGVVTTTATAREEADIRVTGTAVQVYAAVWNRGTEPTVNDDQFWPRWRERVHISWG